MMSNADTHWLICRVRDCGVSSSKWGIHITPLPPEIMDPFGRGGEMIVGAKGNEHLKEIAFVCITMSLHT